MVSHKVLVAIILLNVYIGVQSLFYLFGGVVLTLVVAMAFLNGPRLLDWASSPPHLQFNKYVLTGYRPISSVQDCIRSLFYLHNELGNIYTHGESMMIVMMMMMMVELFSLPMMKTQNLKTWKLSGIDRVSFRLPFGSCPIHEVTLVLPLPSAKTHLSQAREQGVQSFFT